MIKKFVLYALIGVIGVQPYMQASYVDAVRETAQTVVSEGEKIVVPLTSAMVNLGEACFQGVIAGGRILWVTTNVGVKCVYIFSEGCLHLVRFSGEYPQFVTGVVVGAGAAYLISQYNKRQANYYRQKTARDIGDNARLIRGRAPFPV